MSRQISPLIEKILSVGRQAPSSHNAQPWHVQVDGATVTLGYRPERQLVVGDPDKRELFISLGCFIESFVLAAEDLGYQTVVKFVGEQPENLVSLELKAAKQSVGDWSKLIVERRSDRRLYKDKPLPAAQLKQIRDLSQGQANLALATEPAIISFLADQTYEATLAAMSDPAFRSELASWVRNNWTKRADGMPAYVQGIPGPISLIAKTVIKKNQKVALDQAKKDSLRVKHSSAIGLIMVPKPNVQNWLDAGRLYQRLCLTALLNDIKTAGLSAAIINPATTEAIVDKLGLKGQPVALVRLGYVDGQAKASPRLTVHDLVVS